MAEVLYTTLKLNLVHLRVVVQVWLLLTAKHYLEPIIKACETDPNFLPAKEIPIIFGSNYLNARQRDRGTEGSSPPCQEAEAAHGLLAVRYGDWYDISSE